MLAEMRPGQLREWMALEVVEPMEPLLALALGAIAALLYNANRGKDADALHPEDFFPHLKAPEREPTPEEVAHAAKRLRWQAKLAAWKTGNVLMPSVRPPEMPTG
jgi:hypothetical protein